MREAVAARDNGTEMHVAPPASPGPRIEELGDTLVVTFRARRSLGELIGLGIWLTGWTFGGIMAVHAIAGAPWSARVFLSIWLCGWVLGEGAVALLIAWKLTGREVLTITSHLLEVRRKLGRFAAPWGKVHVLAIDDVRAERVPTGEDENTRTDFPPPDHCSRRHISARWQWDGSARGGVRGLRRAVPHQSVAAVGRPQA